jgi:hypothetical protein
MWVITGIRNLLVLLRMVSPVPGLSIEIRAPRAEKNWGSALRWRNTTCRDGPQHQV